MTNSILSELIQAQNKDISKGIVSICSANLTVLEAILSSANEINGNILIESTSNQVNQYGGYLNMQPSDFIENVNKLADKYNINRSKIIYGGDHLGVLPWQGFPVQEALKKGSEMIYEYAKAGYQKIHLDASFPLKGDNNNLTPDIVFQRSAILCEAAEKGYKERLKDFPNSKPPYYVIGSEVPFPGGDFKANGRPTPTSKSDLLMTIEKAEKSFKEKSLNNAWDRVKAIVIETGAEFDKFDIYDFDDNEFDDISELLKNDGRFVFEGHSTDYQIFSNLKKMVENRIAILKVGPALTFAYREVLFALEKIERELFKNEKNKLSNFSQSLDNLMKNSPEDWHEYYHGEEKDKRLARKYSYYDRCRYYIADPEIKKAIEKMLSNLDAEIPLPLISQYLPNQYQKIRKGKISNNCIELIYDYINQKLFPYFKATKQL